MSGIPISIGFLVATAILVVVSIEAGFRLGRGARRRSEDEKESPVSAISAAILGLLAFILAFMFGIVSARYDARKELVRDEANAIRTAYSRSEFLSEADRAVAATLLKEYVDDRLAAARPGNLSEIPALMVESDRIQRELWDMAVVNARKDMNSDVAALYVEALNEVTNLHWMRVAIGLQMRVPIMMWVILYALIILGMIGVGYQTAIAGSRRTRAALILALSFSLVMVLIAELDRPGSSMITVTQRPLEDLRVWMDAGRETP
jgi:hypothetical protein